MGRERERERGEKVCVCSLEATASSPAMGASPLFFGRNVAPKPETRFSDARDEGSTLLNGGATNVWQNERLYKNTSHHRVNLVTENPASHREGRL